MSSNAARSTPARWTLLREAGAAGVIAGRIIDASGQALDCSYNRRVISADLSSLRADSEKRLIVVQEDSKFEPLLAALAGGLCTHLVVGAGMARRLLDHAEPGGRKGILTNEIPAAGALSSRRRGIPVHSNIKDTKRTKTNEEPVE